MVVVRKGVPTRQHNIQWLKWYLADQITSPACSSSWRMKRRQPNPGQAGDSCDLSAKTRSRNRHRGSTQMSKCQVQTTTGTKKGTSSGEAQKTILCHQIWSSKRYPCQKFVLGQFNTEDNPEDNTEVKYQQESYEFVIKKDEMWSSRVEGAEGGPQGQEIEQSRKQLWHSWDGEAGDDLQR